MRLKSGPSWYRGTVNIFKAKRENLGKENFISKSYTVGGSGYFTTMDIRLDLGT